MSLRALLVAAVAVAMVPLSACGRPLVDANNAAPIAGAGADLSVLVGADVAFDASGSTDPDGVIESFAWDFGDGESGDGLLVRHAWSTAGGYVVTLVVVDDDGVESSDTAVVRVQEQLPVARIVGATAAGVVGQLMSFDGSTSSGPAPLSTFAWSFGDGAAAVGPAVEHAWATAGTFAVRLVVTDTDGLVADATTDVDIAQPDLSGTWDLVGDEFACARYSAAFPDGSLLVAQDGDVVTAQGANGRVYSGTVEDGQITLQGAVSIDTGGSCSAAVVDVVLRADLSGTSSFSGRATGFFDLPVGCQCSAAWDMEGTRR